MTSYNNTIKVVARFRPPNKTELEYGEQNIVEFDTEDTCTVQSREATGAFTFDRVFDMASQQSDVFDYSIKSTVDDVINGYNGTVFAYGQTGAGKSYTMMGADIDDERGKGIIPRIIQQIFAGIADSPYNIEWTVTVSYMEIYMERIRDLLAPANDNLPIHEEKLRGVYVKGLAEPYVDRVEDILELLRRGGMARATAATKMNQESSRSHSILVLRIGQKNLETGSTKMGRLYLVDLAGSEKVGKTGASGQTLEEAKKINKSLSALGMVINALTDGKSTHIPYRDSKLTRILQESLGGNSRTTLIINCSPSNYNAEETLSTLRFGVRAKKIENKATVNAELSPAELKILLNKANRANATAEDYINSLEGEVSIWRRGESVPTEKWTPARAEAATKKSEPKQPPSTPSRMTSSDGRRPETPSRPDSRLDIERDIDRASTPSVALEKDERDEFLRRENELQDLLADKESQANKAEEDLKRVTEELQTLKAQQKQTSAENERLQSETNEFKMQVEKLQFEGKETQITMDSVKEANVELTAELDDVKKQLIDAKISVSETAAALDEKEKKKAERMAEMLGGFELGDDALGEKEQSVRNTIQQLEMLIEKGYEGEKIPPEKLEDLKKRLVDAQGIVRQAETSLVQRLDHDEAMQRRHEALEERLAKAETDYEAILEQNLSEEDIEDVKRRLGDAYVNRQGIESDMVEDLRIDLEARKRDNQALREEITTLQQRLQSNGTTATANGAPPGGNAPGKTIQQQIADFDVMKKSLMRDLQNRCERVVELEISLDETREQYNNVLRTSNNKAQAKKLAFLERNLEQLTVVQRQLLEQNNSLKKEISIAERKLTARNDRIQSLHSLLDESQEKLTAANHRFETQLSAVKERLEAAKAGSTRGLGAANANGGFNMGGVGSRIAKPLRGGGGNANGTGPVVPTVAGLQAEQSGGKRSSWLRGWPSGGTSWT